MSELEQPSGTLKAGPVCADDYPEAQVTTPVRHRPAAMTAREVETLFTSVAFEAGISLFQAYDVSLEPTDIEAYSRDPNLTLVGIIGFAGRDISGTLVLGATQEPLERSKPDRASQRDWIAELANQLLGRIKNRVMRSGIEFYAMPPAVVSGQHLAPVTGRPDFKPWVYATPGGTVCLWIEVCAAAELHTDDELIASEIPGEGEILLF